MNLSFLLVFSILSTLFASAILPFGQFAYAEEHDGTSTGSESDSMPLDAATITGKYADSEVGYEIEFQEGWEGINFLGFVIAAPGGVDMEEETDKPAIVIAALNKDGLQELTDSEDFLSAIRGEKMDESCSNPTQEIVEINGASAYKLAVECTEEDFEKAIIHIFSNKDNVIVVMYGASTTALFEQGHDDFEKTIKTMTVHDPTDIVKTLHEIAGTKANANTVTARGATVDVVIDSTAAISGFNFNESGKQLSFRAEAPVETVGLVSVHISSVLEGPYAVSVNGDAVEDLQIIDDKVNKEKLIQLTLPPGKSDIDIIGTTVVPEFPASLLVMGLAIFGVLAVLRMGKFRLK
jgi:hypothetical protein